MFNIAVYKKCIAMKQISLYEVVKPHFTDEELVNFEAASRFTQLLGIKTEFPDSERNGREVDDVILSLRKRVIFGTPELTLHELLADKPADFLRKTKGTIYEGLFYEFRRRQQGKCPRRAFRVSAMPFPHVRFIE